jgi:hypothetical protein
MDNASRKGDTNAPNKDQAEMNTAPAKPGDDSVGKMDKDVDVKLDNAKQTDSDVKTDASVKTDADKADADTQSDADTRSDADAKMDAGSAAMKGGAECQGTREQLRKRVEARVTDLENELAKCDANATNERALGLRTELQVAKDAVGGGWEHVGEMEALRLSKWLQATSTLVARGSGDSDNGPEAMMGSNKPSDGSVTTTEKPGVTLNALGQEVPPTYPT